MATLKTEVYIDGKLIYTHTSNRALPKEIARLKHLAGVEFKRSWIDEQGVESAYTNS